tara:strand:- start:78 stop:2972 length:2895 start_codon:yes stop_codon:yes gene_type:complete
MLSDIKREYIVTVREHGDLENFYDEMETAGSAGCCPDREVECLSRRNISRNTHYKLSELDVDKLKNHPNVINIELAPHERGIEATPLWGPQSGDFQKSTNINSGDLNWGLKRVLDGVQTANWGTNGQTTFNDTIQTGSSGKNVDLVIVDSHVNHEHPEFWRNRTNNALGSRMNQIDWFGEYAAAIGDSYGTGKTYNYSSTGYGTPGQSNHGTHVAGTAGGNTQGWARDANLYNIAFSTTLVNDASGTVYPDFATYLFDYLREFHRKKPINSKTGRKNPTVANHSWGYNQGSPDLNSITSVTYRGNTTQVTGTDPERKIILEANGVPVPFNTTLYRVPVRVLTLEADIEDAIRDGIIMVGSAGNSYWLCEGDVSAVDYNNSYNIGASVYSHSKGSSPAAHPWFISVGSVGELVEEHKSTFSNTGSGIDIWAPGSNIISSVFDTTASTEGYGTLVNDPRDANFKVADISGTSMSGPQVAGYLACVAEQEPNLKYDEALQHLIDYSKQDQVSDSALDGYGEALFSTPGSAYWTCPVGITTIAVVCIGAGGGAGGASPQDGDGGGGGGLAYKNNISVTPGVQYLVSVGQGGVGGSNGGAGSNGQNTQFSPGGGIPNVTALGGGGGSGSGGSGGAGGGYQNADGGGNGGAGGMFNSAQGGGGGAGGYSGNGGQGAGSYPGGSGSAGSGGGGGGGFQAPGGGVGIFGEGANGAASDLANSNRIGYPGSGGKGGYSGGVGPNGASDDGSGIYGGGGFGGYQGGKGGVRIVWWGPNSPQRAFPSTNVSQTTLWSQDYKNLGPNTNNRYLYFQKSRPDEGLVYPHDTFKSRTTSTTKYPRQKTATNKTEQFAEIYQWDFNVTASGGFYFFDDAYDRLGTVRDATYTTITCKKGDNLQFNINASGHPFFISNRLGNGMPSPSETPVGITNNGADNAVVVWDTTNVAPGLYWFNCQYHSNMYGNINITESAFNPA